MSSGFHNPALVPPGIGPAHPAAPVRQPTQPVRPQAPGAPQGPAFADVLRDAATRTEAVQFSKHALQRLERRGLTVDGAAMERLNEGVSRAAGKGARDAVVLVDDTAFVVSVRNRTVITAVGRDQMKDQVFTNIDSAVIA
jgi:flagellar operon protein